MNASPNGIIVGTGRAGIGLHLPSLRANGANIAAFVDIDEAAGKKAAEAHGVPIAATSLERAIEETVPDFVSVCTTVPSHFPLAKIALEMGVHVLVEKPMTSTLEEAEELRRISERTGKSVCVVHNHKFYPGIAEAKRLLATGRFGEVMHVYREMSFFHERVRMMEGGHWAHALPGGRLFEANPHNLYLLYGFLGELELASIEPRKVSERWPHARFDEFHATFRTARATAGIKMSLHAEPDGEYDGYGPNFMVVTGTKGALLVDYHQALPLGDAMIGKRLYARLPAMLGASFKARLSKPPADAGVGSGHYYYMKEYLAFLRGDRKEPPVDWDEALFVERMNEEMGERAEAYGL